MAFDVNNNSNFSNVKQYNQREATQTSNGERLVPLEALQRYIPAPVENQIPRNGNPSKGRLNQHETLLCQAYQPPNDLSFIGSNANVNPMPGGTDGNWFNEQVQNAPEYVVNQPSALQSGPVQQQGYPLNYAPDSSITGFQDLQSFADANWTSTPSSFIDSLHQYPNQNQFDANRAVAQDNQLLFRNNAWEVNNDNDSTPRPLNNGAALPNGMIPIWPNGTYNPATSPDLPAGIGPNLQNIHHQEINLTTASAVGGYVYPNVSFSNITCYPAPTLFPASSDLLYPTNQNVSPNTLPTDPSTIDASSSSSPPPSSIPGFKKSDEVPGLYEQIDKKKWVCTFQKCGLVMHGKRNRKRHIGVHAKWEETLIEGGYLKPEDAVAIPRAALVTYECEDPRCPYLLETGKSYYVKHYRVDGYRRTHRKNFHPDISTSKRGKQTTRRKTTKIAPKYFE